MSTYQRKPIIVQAMQFEGTQDSADKLIEFVPDGVKKAIRFFPAVLVPFKPSKLIIRTPHGDMEIFSGTWFVIEGSTAEGMANLQCVPDDAFKMNYDCMERAPVKEAPTINMTGSVGEKTAAE